MPSHDLNDKNNNKSLALTTVSIILCIAGFIMGCIALSAPLGVWINAWDFRKGFSLLRFTNTWGGWVAVGIILLTVLVMIIAKISHTNDKLKFAALGLTGTLAAALSFYIPESFRPPENTNVPPIHDITTNTSSPVEFVDIIALRGSTSNSIIYGDSPDLTPEKLAALQAAAYPEIETQYYSEDNDIIFDRAVKIARELGWEIVSEDRSTGRIEAIDTTFWFRFKDDIAIKIESENGKTVLNARSLSRVGISDVGKNAARLRQFFELMKIS